MALEAKQQETMENIEEIVTKEIAHTHIFFVAWFCAYIEGKLKITEFEKFKARFHPKFMMDTPTSKGLNNEAVMKWIESAYASEKNSGFSIRIKNEKILDRNIKEDKAKIDLLINTAKSIDVNEKDLIYAEYEEWQQYKDKSKNTVRQSHVAFTINGGIQWRALRERWL